MKEQELHIIDRRLQSQMRELQAQSAELHLHAEKLENTGLDLMAAYESLRESREDLKKSQAVAQIGSWRMNLQDSKMSCSEEIYNIFQISLDFQPSYEYFLTITHPEDREYVNRKWHAALEGEPFNIEHRIIVGDTVKWVQERAELEFNENGQFIGGFGTIQDITERRQSDEALRLNHQRLILLTESASQLLSGSAPSELIGMIGRKIMEYLNCDIFFNFLRDEPDLLHLNSWAGISQEEASGVELLKHGIVMCDSMTQDGYILVEDISDAENPCFEFLKAYGIQTYICQTLSIGGKVFGSLSFGTHKKKNFNADELMLIQAVADQMAVAMERRQFEKELFYSRKRERSRAEELQAILDTAPIPLLICRDSYARVITGNPAAYEILKLEKNYNLSLAAPSAQRAPYKVIADGAEIPLEELPLRQAINGQTVQNREYDLLLADGSIRHITMNAVPLLNGTGQTRGAVGAVMDLTELKQAQKALRRAHDELEERVQERTEILNLTVAQLQEEVAERQRAEAELTKQSEIILDLYNRAPCGYHSLNPEGFFVRINDTELEWLGYSRNEVIGRMHIEDIISIESLEKFHQTYSELKRVGRVQDLEFDFKRQDGSFFPVLLNSTAVTDETGKFLMSRCTVYDLTQRKRGEQDLRESEERLRFLAGKLLKAQEQERKRLAGELHDELGHALVTLKISLGSITRQLPPEQENLQNLLEDQLAYINHVIEEVRRLYNDLSPGDLEDLGLTKALANLIEEFGSHQPDLTFSVNLPDLGRHLNLTTATIIYRLVQEALTNIGKYAEATQIEIWAREEKQHLNLVIEDNGRGFDLKEVEQDVNRGMGLAAMRERVYILGGSLEISSQMGAGTKLSFVIPIK